MGSSALERHSGKVWWVNQGKSFEYEFHGGYLWAPLEDKSGKTPWHWAALKDTLPGDVILNYSKSYVRAVSQVAKPPRETNCPRELAGYYGDKPGIIVECKYHKLTRPIPKGQFSSLPKVLSVESGPFDTNGNVKLGYLFRFSLEALQSVASKFNTDWPTFVVELLSGTEESSHTILITVNTIDQVVDNVRRFHQETEGPQADYEQLPIDVRQYFAYDPMSGWFAPAKYAGFADMTLQRYLSLRDDPPAKFDGHSTHLALEKVCNGPAKNPKVLERLKAWLIRWNMTYSSSMTVFSAGEIMEPPLLEVFITELKKIRRDTSSGYPKPYKPLLLLAAIQTMLDGQQLTFGPPLLDYYREFGRAINADTSDPHYPYYHLTNDGFWVVLNADGSRFTSHGTPNKSTLVGTTARLEGGREECILDDRLRPYVIKAIKTHFSDEQWERLCEVWPPLSEEGARSSTVNPPEANPVNVIEPIPDLSQITNEFSRALKASHVSFGRRHDDFVRSFVASLVTKRFAILTGLSGSGKTQIALQFGCWLGGNRCKVIPVRPDWTGSEALFGYPDALRPQAPDGRRQWYVPEALEFMLQAARDPLHPYLLILDEMNLAHVERYFADVLSGMESEEPCLPNLRLEDNGWYPDPDGPAKLCFPKNLFLIGTVNVDETTYMFSPKVLDRANTIEFIVDTDDLSDELEKPTRCAPGDLGLVLGLLELATDDGWQLNNPHPEKDQIAEQLKKLHGLLSDDGFAFGHRVFYEALRFSSFLAAAGEENPDKALDLIVMQKILPRLHGGRRRLEPVLSKLGQFAFDLTISEDEGAPTSFDPLSQPGAAEPRLEWSFAKVRRMMRKLRANQFASFAE